MSDNNWNDDDGLRDRVKKLLFFCLVLGIALPSIMLVLGFTEVSIPLEVKSYLHGITASLQAFITILFFLVLPNR